MSTDHRDHQTGTTGSDSPLTSVPGRPAHAHFENRYSAQIEMVWTGGGPVDVPVVPNGYELRQFRSDDEAAYNELFHLAFADQNTLIQTRETALEQGLFVVEHIGSQLGWLVGDPAHAGKRLGTIVSAMVTNRLATAEYALPYLQTNDFRFEAIAIYLKLGWRPYLFADDMEPRWRDVYAGMGLTYTSDDGVVA